MDYYGDDELLMISGIQHFAFCERQWALIHIEQQWSENVLTVEGHHLHEHADDPFFTEKRKDMIRFRSVQIVSKKLGLYGRADIIEWRKTSDEDSNAVKLPGYEGKWKPMPVEYKHGKPKPDERDEVQLCAQAVCLEEAHNITIEKGALYYGETRHRQETILDETLRNKVESYALRMHQLYNDSLTPPPIYKSHCKSCSLIDSCLPKQIANNQLVGDYLKYMLEEI